MDGTLMSELHGNLHLLSELNLRLLIHYFENGTLSSQDRDLLLNEITKAKATLQAQSSPA
jgi:hypothetical protein